MADSVYDRLGRQRPPRVHIRYDVETNGAIELKEIPFVVGVLADLSGQPEEPLPRLQDRKFIDIHQHNFDTVLQGMKPRIVFRVPNTLTNDRTQFPVELRFSRLEDFEPAQVVKQIEPLHRLLEVRQDLKMLLTKMTSKENLEKALGDVIHNTELLQQVGNEGGLNTDKDAGETPSQG